jgi:hypothetical protein
MPKGSSEYGLDFRAAFTIGGTSSTGCPPQYDGLQDEVACESLAAIAGAVNDDGTLTPKREEYPFYPAGCFRHTITSRFYWNTHSVGRNNAFAQPLCAGAPHARTAAMPASRMQE